MPNRCMPATVRAEDEWSRASGPSPACLASCHQRLREIVVGIRISRIQFKRTSESPNGLVRLAEALESGAEVDVRCRRPGS